MFIYLFIHSDESIRIRCRTSDETLQCEETHNLTRYSEITEHSINNQSYKCPCKLRCKRPCILPFKHETTTFANSSRETTIKSNTVTAHFNGTLDFLPFLLLVLPSLSSTSSTNPYPASSSSLLPIFTTSSSSSPSILLLLHPYSPSSSLLPPHLFTTPLSSFPPHPPPSLPPLHPSLPSSCPSLLMTFLNSVISGRWLRSSPPFMKPP